MEDNTKQPLTADASLYNGQPTDTGSSCPSAGLTSCTSSTSDDVRNGVSVENVPFENKQWFVLRVLYGRIIKAKAFVEAKEAGKDFAECLDAMNAAAEKGWQSTKDLVAKIGRASRLGERSRGVLDAGATSCYFIITTIGSTAKSLL